MQYKANFAWISLVFSDDFNSRNSQNSLLQCMAAHKALLDSTLGAHSLYSNIRSISVYSVVPEPILGRQLFSQVNIPPLKCHETRRIMI